MRLRRSWDGARRRRHSRRRCATAAAAAAVIFVALAPSQVAYVGWGGGVASVVLYSLPAGLAATACEIAISAVLTLSFALQAIAAAAAAPKTPPLLLLLLLLL